MMLSFKWRDDGDHCLIHQKFRVSYRNFCGNKELPSVNLSKVDNILADLQTWAAAEVAKMVNIELE